MHRGIPGSIDHLRFSNELRAVRLPAMWQWRHSTKSLRSSWEGGRSFGGWDIWTISCYNWEGHERTYGKLSEHLQQCIPLASSAMERNSLILYATFLSGVISNDDWTLKSINSILFLPMELLYYNRNSWGVETCNSHMFALSDARDYSFSKVPYLEREEEITDQSNFVNNVT